MSVLIPCMVVVNMAGQETTSEAESQPDRLQWNIRSVLLLVSLFGMYWCISAFVLWWAYSISAQIRGGYYEYSQALSLVEKMGLITTLVTSIAWLFARWPKA